MFESIPKRLEKDYHSIKDDVPLVSVYTTRNVTIKGMLILDDLLTDDIRETKEYKDYAKEFVGKKRKGKHVARETSSLRKSLKITIKQQKPISTTYIPPPSDDKEREDIHEATLLSLALHKTAKIVEEQENVAAVEEKILEEDVEKIIEPKSHKENLETINDDDDDVIEKKEDDDNDDDDNDDDDN
ncbi:hypothetical protein Tco_1363706, partial [Tanacetum coccineum]